MSGEPMQYIPGRADDATSLAFACRSKHADARLANRILHAAGLNWHQLDPDGRRALVWLALWDEQTIEGIASIVHTALLRRQELDRKYPRSSP